VQSSVSRILNKTARGLPSNACFRPHSSKGFQALFSTLFWSHELKFLCSVNHPMAGNIIVGQKPLFKRGRYLRAIFQPNTVPSDEVLIAFNEASCPSLAVRRNDAELKALAIRNACALFLGAAGMCSGLAMGAKRLPNQLLGRNQGRAPSLRYLLRHRQPRWAIIAETEQVRGILVVVDGERQPRAV